MKPLCITCRPEDLDQGLFGQVLPNVLQILPHLYREHIFPAWEIRSRHYADAPDYIALPGVFDLSYTPAEGAARRVSLNEMRRRHSQILGSNWAELAQVWNAYFTVPERTAEQVKAHVPPGKRLLGVHYRGTDKQTSSWDSNAITQGEFLELLQDFLAQQPPFDGVIAASDEQSFIENLKQHVSLPVTNLGAVEFHLSPVHSTTRAEKADRALVDCLLLSKCAVVIETSSALPSFAKLFNPEIEIYRCAASRVFSNMPYFPVAFIPVLPVSGDRSKAVLQRTMRDDWTSHPAMDQYKKPFSFVPRWPRNHKWFALAEKARMDGAIARVFTGYR